MGGTVNIATVHWRDPRWIDVQARAIARHFTGPVRVFANLEGIDGYDDRFYRTNRDGGEHATKLNSLGREIVEESDDDDIVIFLDGDAFPVRNMDSWIDDLLSSAPLAAIQRLDNAGDVQPHPCFCVTTTRFWREIGGDWRRGPFWTNARGVQVTDVGATLLKQLDDENVNWGRIHRSNDIDIHPLMFGVYGRHIYHHGAGFRSAILRIDGSDLIAPYIDFREKTSWRRVPQFRPRHVEPLLRAAQARVRGRKVLKRSEELKSISQTMFEEIKADPDFYRQFEAPRLSR